MPIFFLLISLSCSLSNKPANHSYRELCLRYTHNNVCRLFAVNDILYKILFQVAVFSDQKESLSNEITKKKTSFKATSFKAKQKAKKKKTQVRHQNVRFLQLQRQYGKIHLQPCFSLAYWLFGDFSVCSCWIFAV